MTLDIPGQGTLTIETIIFDLNGTLAIGGELVKGVEDKLLKLKQAGFKLILFSGDSRGNAPELAQRTGMTLINVTNGQDKLKETLKLNPQTCASIGNGLIDKPMMQAVRLAIVTLQAEGVHTETLSQSDLVVPTVNDAIDLFLDTYRLIASLRK